PLRYAVLKEHPGDGLTFAFDPSAYNWWPASEVMHWFRASRASHARGIPRYTAGLPLHAHKRAFTRSVLGAARIAAMFAGVLKTNLPPENGPAVVQAYDEVPFDHDGLLTMPEGWEASQFKAEQPTATHKDFSDSLATEFGRGIHAPRNIVTGDSSPYNYSSARLDHIIYRGALKVARNRFAIRWHDRVFAAWFAEAVVVLPGLAGLPPLAEWSWAWRYDAFPSIDPVKDATAAEIEQRIGLLNYADALADRGIDWREHFRQKAREREFARAEGVEDLFFPVKAPAPGAAGGAADPEAMRAQIRAMVQDEIDTVLEDRGVSHVR
ncbi:MAG TPA: phage portal protein, partial [Gemmataceae bacterium]|nr:phage portal protein [Gemmataceae bacterium]